MRVILILKQNVKVVLSESTVLKQIKETKTLDIISENQENKDVKEQNNIEPLLQETSNQYVIFPINHDDMWNMYKELVGSFWSVTETLENLDALALDYNEKKVNLFN